MPRIPRPPYGEPPKVVAVSPSASENIKISILEDRLRDQLVPKDTTILELLENLSENEYLYIYNENTKELKKVSASNFASISEDVVNIADKVQNLDSKYDDLTRAINSLVVCGVDLDSLND